MTDVGEVFTPVVHRSSRLFWTLLSVITLSVTSADGQFEGTVESKNVTTDDTGRPQEFVMTMWIKKDRIRVQTSAFGTTPGTTMIYRKDRRVVWMLNEEAHTYFEMLQEEPRQEGRQAPLPPPDEKLAVKKTGKTKKILGYPAEQFLVKGQDQETEVWGTRQLSTLSSTVTAVLGGEQASGGWMDELSGMGIFPLAAFTRIDGKVVESQEIVRIEERPMPSDLFELPAGFRKQAVGEGMEEPGGH